MFVYSSLYRYKAGPGVSPSAYQLEPDVAEAMPEISDDGLTYTVKLRNDVMWHPPLERPLDAEDIVFSWERFTGQMSGVPASPEASLIQSYLDSVEAVDANTVRFNLSSPRGDFLSTEGDWIVIMPKEAGEAFDPAQQMVGTGPWIFEEYNASQSIRYRRNPNWHLGPDAPYFDNVEIAIIPEYANRLSQFLNGELDELEIQGIDLARAQQTVPDLQLFVGMDKLPNSLLSFPLAQTTNDPWGDPRVRKAVSMSLDRDAMLDAAYSLTQVEAAGVEVDRRWNNDMSALDSAYWLDPQGNFQFQDGDPQMTPENLASFRYDPEGARQLLDEAGYPDGFTAPLYTTSQYGEAFDVISELTQAYAGEIGVNFSYELVDYASHYIPEIIQNLNYEGALHVARGTGIVDNLELYYIPGAAANYASIDDPELSEMIEDIITEIDSEAQRIKVLEAQNVLNDKMYYIPMQLGAAGGYKVYAPNVRNVLDYQVVRQGFGNETVPYYWRA